MTSFNYWDIELVGGFNSLQLVMHQRALVNAVDLASRALPDSFLDNMGVGIASSYVTGNRWATVKNRSLSPMSCPPLPPHP